MKRLLLIIVALVLLPTMGHAQGVVVGPGGVRVDDGYRGDRGRGRGRGRGVDCGQLRQACMMKEQLGEQGAGNCRRYRSLCR